MNLTSEHLTLISEHDPIQRHERSLLKAAVAIILRDTDRGTEFLLMQRAQHPSDPWSGQMSFPGGKIDPSDVSAKAAAIRETREEVGIELRDEDYIGRLDDLFGLKVDNQYSVHVSAFVFKPDRALSPVGNHEVADLVWLPFAWLKEAGNGFDYIHPQSDSVKMPAVLINKSREQVFWGLSLRIMSMLFELLGEDLPVLSHEKQAELRKIEEQNMNAKDLDEVTQDLFDREAS